MNDQDTVDGVAGCAALAVWLVTLLVAWSFVHKWWNGSPLAVSIVIAGLCYVVGRRRG